MPSERVVHSDSGHKAFGRPRALARRLGLRALLWMGPVLVAAAVGAFVFFPQRGDHATTRVASGPPAGSGKASATVSGGRVNARLLYLQTCAVCHGTTGLGSVRGPSLSHIGAAAVAFYLSTGRMPKRNFAHKTPPYTPVYPPKVISALVKYVTKLVAHGGPKIPYVNPAIGNVAKGGVLFRLNCAVCHGWGGAGGELTDRPIPNLRQATPAEIGEAIRVGPSQMPVFGTQAISNKELSSVAAYVRYMQHPQDRGGNALSYLGPVSEGAVTWLIAIPALLAFIRWTGKRAS